MIEQDTRYIIDSNLSNKGWVLDINSPKKNVFFETDINRILDNSKLKKSKLKPDYVLVDSNRKPIGVIEAKAGGKNLDYALEQATEYASLLQAPLIFAMNNSYCQTKHLYTNKPLFINDNEVNELIKQTEAVKFLHENSNSIYTVPQDIILSRQDLISNFKQINAKLRQLGFQAGYERLSEFANLLFLKLYSENTNDEMWSDIKNAGNTAIVGAVNNSLKVIEKQYNIDGAIFKDTSITNPQSLKDIISKLDKLHFSTIDTDIKGDAFEYFIQKTPSADKDLGEYFTPRHIIKTVVNLVKPKFKETVYDPFCGSGGFLTESFTYIKENAIINNPNDKKILSEKSFFGGEISNTARLAKMNMILHGDGHSGIKQIDSISNPVRNKYDIVLTNIPFGLKDLGEFSTLYNNGLAKNNGEGICLLHCFNAVKKGGRMAIIVPEGALFIRSLAETRKHFLYNAKLVAVISLPSGTFLPYTSAKTNILYFTDCHTKKTNKVWFFNVNNDGFSLDQARNPIKKNDLKKVDYANFNIADKEIEELGFYSVDIEKIKNNKYFLIGSQYTKISYASNSYKMVKIKDICKVELGNSAPQDPKLFEQGSYPFFRVSDLAKYHLSNNLVETASKLNINGIKKLKKFPKNTLLIPKSGATTKLNHRALMGTDGYVTSHLACIIANETFIMPEYLYYIFLTIDANTLLLNDSYPSIRKEAFEKVMIPLPPLEKQGEIVKQLEEIDNSIKHAENLVKSMKSRGGGYCNLFGQTASSMIKLGDIALINPSKSEISEKEGLKVSFLPMEDIKEYEKNVIPNKIKLIQDVYKGYTYFKKDDLLVAKITPCFENGKMSIAKNLINGIGCGSTEYIVVRANKKITSVEWIYFCLRNSNFLQDGKNKMTGTSGHQRISKDFINNYLIPIPSLEVQEEIIQQCEEEENYIKITEKMIEKQKEKIDLKLKEIWVGNKDKLNKKE
ncbi:N-6 DNA methylase [Candidatus Hepatincola sp. Av]